MLITPIDQQRVRVLAVAAALGPSFSPISAASAHASAARSRWGVRAHGLSTQGERGKHMSRRGPHQVSRLRSGDLSAPWSRRGHALMCHGRPARAGCGQMAFARIFVFTRATPHRLELWRLLRRRP
jgi:hypothetical protein